MTTQISIAPDVAEREHRALEIWLRQRGLIQAQAIADLQVAISVQNSEIERLRTLLAANNIDPDPPGNEDTPEGESA